MALPQVSAHIHHSIRNGFLIFMTVVLVVLIAFTSFLFWLRDTDYADIVDTMQISYFQGKIYNDFPASAAQTDGNAAHPISRIGVGPVRQAAVVWKNEDDAPIIFTADFVDGEKIINPGETLYTVFDTTTMKNGEYKYTIGSYSDAITIMSPVGLR